jgi:cytochrome c biogenesis protein CcmG/thiol:disulfide interchange protein DsbE
LNKRLLFILPVALLIGLAVLFAVGLRHDPSIVPSVLLDKPAPVFDLPPLSEDQPGLATVDLNGKVSLVNVFASWCGPCRVEHPLFMRLAEQGEVPIYGINYKDKAADAKRWLRDLGDPYTRIGVDRDGRVAIEWGVYGVPETFVIDREGTIRFKHVGPLSPEVLSETILPLVRKLQQ